MKKVLLVLSTTRKSPASIAAALKAAQERAAELLILFVIDRQHTDQVIKLLTEEGWIGGNPSKKLYQAMQTEYRMLARSVGELIRQIAERKGASARHLIVEGNYTETVLNVIAQEEIDLVILTRRRRSALSRWLFGSAVAEIKKRSRCPVQIVDE